MNVTDTKSPNIDNLRQLYRQSPVAKAFFDHAARRERDQSETKVDRILVLLRAEGHEFRRREVIDLFRKLQDQGCGQFVARRSSPDLTRNDTESELRSLNWAESFQESCKSRKREAVATQKFNLS